MHTDDFELSGQTATEFLQFFAAHAVKFSDAGFHVNGALLGPRRLDELTPNRRQARYAELVFLEAKLLGLDLRNGILAGEWRQPFDFSPHVRLREIDHAFGMS